MRQALTETDVTGLGRSSPIYARIAAQHASSFGTSIYIDLIPKMGAECIPISRCGQRNYRHAVNIWRVCQHEVAHKMKLGRCQAHEYFSSEYLDHNQLCKKGLHFLSEATSSHLQLLRKTDGLRSNNGGRW